MIEEFAQSMDMRSSNSSSMGGAAHGPNECVIMKALNFALVVVPVGDMCGSEKSLTGFLFALDACDLEE